MRATMCSILSEPVAADIASAMTILLLVSLLPQV
jgi:hypothetical protein